MTAVSWAGPQRFAALVATFVVAVVGLVVTSPSEARATGPCSTAGATTAYAGGDGSTSTPFLIATPQQLALLSATSADWGKHFRQTANIDLGGCQWTSIGVDTVAPFTGSYDGGGFRISGLSIGDQIGTAVGLFGLVGGVAPTGVTITNLTLAGTIDASDSRVGGLAGYILAANARATFSKIRVEMDITYRGGDYAGGIVGEATNVDILYSSYEGNFSSTSDFGVTAGIGGWGNSSTNRMSIVDSYARAAFSGSSTLQGGISGWNSATVTRSYSASSAGDAGVAISTLFATGVFWDTTVGPSTANRTGQVSGATGLDSTAMKTRTPYSQASWNIIDGWEPFNTATNKIWGICSGVNDGYPFLLWEYTSNPCPAPPGGSSGSGTSAIAGPAIHLDLKANVGDQISGRPVEIAGTGLGGGSAYSLVVRSTPTTLDSGSASGLGSFSNTLRMPALSSGDHTLTLTATAPDGSTLSLVQSFTVSASGVVTAVSEPVGMMERKLAATGADSGAAMSGFGIAFALIAIGAIARLATRRFAGSAT